MLLSCPYTANAAASDAEAKLELLFGSSSDLLNSHFALACEANPLMAPHDKQEKMKCHV